MPRPVHLIFLRNLYRYSEFLISSVALILLPLATVPAFAVQVHVRDGQTVRLRLRNILTPDNVQKGDGIQFEVTEDILINGHVVIAKGAMGRGKVIEVKGAQKRKAKDAEVVFQFLTVHAVDNQDLALRAVATKIRNSKASVNEVAERSPIPGYPSHLIGAEKGKEYAAYIDAPVIVNAPDTVATPVAPTSPSAMTPEVMAAEPASVEFSSTPSGADILIDATFVGNTPSTLSVTAGRHAIEIRVAGYRSWTRSMIVDPESHPSVRATLIKQ